MVYGASLEGASLCSSFDRQLALEIHDKGVAREEDWRSDHFLTEGRSIAAELPKNGVVQTYPHSKSCWSQEELERKELQKPSQIENGASVASMGVLREMGRTSHGGGGGGGEEELKGLLILNKSENQKLDGNIREAIALVASLKSCAKQKDLHTGCQLHADIVQSGLLQENVFVGNALVNMFAKCGALQKAQDVFDQLVVRDVVSWNALISGYTQNGHAEQALRCFQKMQLAGVSPDAVTFVCLVKACGSIGAIEKGKEIHAQIIEDHSLDEDVHVGTALVDMYCKFGFLSKAQEVFDKLHIRNIVSWTSLIVGFSQHEQGQKAIILFERMKSEAVPPNAVTFSCILKACSSVGAMDKGLEVHAEILKEGLLERNNVVGNSLVDMYSKLDRLERAQHVFDELLVRDVVLWNALITGYAQHDNNEQALFCFYQMRSEGVAPDAITYACAVKACGKLRALYQGQELHAEVVIHGLLELDVVIGTVLIDMYAHCSMLEEAQEVFDDLPVRDVVSWTALIAGYTQSGHGEEALQLFEQMQGGGFFPNAVTFSCILKACGSIGASDRGLIMHSKIVKEGLVEENIVVANALVDMYAKCGLLTEAQKVFDKLHTRDVISWNALILAYCQRELFESALSFFEAMELEGFSPDDVTFSSILKVCGRVGAICKGQKVHAMIASDGLTKESILVGTALVEMYASCGMLAEAEDAFEEQNMEQDVVLWNTLLAGYAQLGKDTVVRILYERMVEKGQEPNVVTHSILLAVFSHQGLLDEGQSQFELLNKSYGFAPSIEHYICMVDLLGRAGRVEEAISLVEREYFCANLAMWFTLLGACQKRGDVKLGIWVFERAVQLDKEEATTYIYMSNVL
ncbi:hypothetical protein GOP47_0008940 [Adiantum capillus-veneris]|uniref:Pentatricopeptide repeat-containing protein n=1 Tax=Adiantum capillus-veneris TaxID=13818 RepID=A0A9D4UZ99_ADICA|nr:hypothetical protein GOP47_0008940 [Adiantum capillus-veneris]